MEQAKEDKEKVTEDGIEDAFEVHSAGVGLVGLCGHEDGEAGGG